MKAEVTRIVDDIDGTEAFESHRFTWQGVEYEIDLSKVNSKELRDIMNYYTFYSRKVPKTDVPKKRVRSQRSQTIRAWAVSKGILVPAKGKIPFSVVDRYYQES